MMSARFRDPSPDSAPEVFPVALPVRIAFRPSDVDCRAVGVLTSANRPRGYGLLVLLVLLPGGHIASGRRAISGDFHCFDCIGQCMY